MTTDKNLKNTEELNEEVVEKELHKPSIPPEKSHHAPSFPNPNHFWKWVWNFNMNNKQRPGRAASRWR